MTAFRKKLRTFWKDLRDQKHDEEKIAIIASHSLPSLQSTQRSGSTHGRVLGRAKRAPTGLPALEAIDSEDEEQKKVVEIPSHDYTYIQNVLQEGERKDRWQKFANVVKENSQRLRDAQGDLENREVAAFERRSKEAAESGYMPTHMAYRGVVDAEDHLSKVQRSEHIVRERETLQVNENRTLRSIFRIDDDIDALQIIKEMDGNGENTLDKVMTSAVFIEKLRKLQTINDRVRDINEKRRRAEELAKLADPVKHHRSMRIQKVEEAPEEKQAPLKEVAFKMDRWMNRKAVAGIFAGSASPSTGRLPPVKTGTPLFGRSRSNSNF